MTSGVKTALIVGGTALGAYLLFKALQPASPIPGKKPAANTDLLTVNGILAGASALKGFFGSTSTPTDNVPSGTIVNTTVTPEAQITDAQEAAFTEGHFGVNYSTL